MSVMQALQGEWRIESLEMNGAALPAAMFAQARVIVNGDQFTSKGMGAEYVGKFSADDSVAPARFSLAFEGGPETGNANHGVFELAGDRWRMCLNMTGGPAPQAFATTPGDGCALQILTRVA